MDICSKTLFKDNQITLAEALLTKTKLKQTESDRRVRGWFEARGWTPFEFQREAWSAYLTGHSGLIHAPTGIGKTYAAWFGPLLEWMSMDGCNQKNATDTATPPLTVLWVTPLRALATDIQATLFQTVKDLQLPWSVECRTGDTAQTVKNRQKNRLPTTLITTPESLNLLLSYPGAREKFSSLQLVVADEWHELMGSKRGVLLELALARLKSWNRGSRVWGLSATLGNTETAMKSLLGDDAGHGRLIRGRQPKSILVESILPEQVERFPWAGHLGLKLLPLALEKIESAKSALIFTNTRSQAELWYQALLEARPQWADCLAMHHGSLDRRQRETVEQGLRSGHLRKVVCTSSLDLGVDFTPVDLVIQIDSPCYGFAGHLHPAVTITGKGRMKENLPCFCFGPRMALMPAFGGFTGNQVIRPTIDDRVYVIAGNEVIEMSRA